MRTCTTCKLELPLTSFSWKNKKKGTYQYTCKSCHKLYRDIHYQNNCPKYKNKAKDYRISLRVEFYTWLKTQQCKDCGISDFRLLEFDHVRGKKMANISSMVGGASKKKLNEEIAKCDIVCANCHRLRTYKRNDSYNYLGM